MRTENFSLLYALTSHLSVQLFDANIEKSNQIGVTDVIQSCKYGADVQTESQNRLKMITPDECLSILETDFMRSLFMGNDQRK